ncbi:MAG: hypothetical protein JWR74_2327, partial [Polaromonas sp.]|nr:hypothetical protein [Polaromonas sp.]
KRVNQRFDEELSKLRPLWVLASPPADPGTAAARIRKN